MLAMLRWVLLLLASCSLGCVAAKPAFATESAVEAEWSRPSLFTAWNRMRGDTYALDGVERWLEPGQRVSCDSGSLVRYTGKRLRYAGSLQVSEPFRERLERFEVLAAEVAREVYGREPRLIRHYGSYSCRSTRNRRHVVSEHALGNALDLVGFDFGPAKKAEPLPDGVPRALRAPFQVSVRRHWSDRAKGEIGALHRHFLEQLTTRLRQRSDIFRCMFGPGHGGHDDHLHLDVAPWRYVDL